MLKTAEFPTKFIVSPKRRAANDYEEDDSGKPQLPRFKKVPKMMPLSQNNLPPSVLLRE